jgi:PncC family amidohydrolase
MLDKLAQSLAAALCQRQVRVVFAESCTAGLVSASLARVPGVSEWHCGSAVTYRDATKQAWLDVPPATIAAHTAVSEAVAERMAVGVLEKTPEADFAASVTGHLGPDAPPEFDGVIYIGIARRDQAGAAQPIFVRRAQLSETSRVPRQEEAAGLVLQQLLETIESEEAEPSKR